MVNNVIQGLICEPCKWVIVPGQAQGHLNDQHSRVHLDQDLFRAALTELEVSDRLPNPPEIGIFPEIVGLAVQHGYACCHCDKALGTIGSMEKHHRHCHPNQPLPKAWSRCHFQQLHPQHAKTIFQIKPRNMPGPTWVDTMINDIRQEMKEVTRINPYERNSRAISPWNLTTQWHKHVAEFEPSELRGLIAMPIEQEFPGLIKAVRAYFVKATSLIEQTDVLVLQRLNSPDPKKE